MNYFVEIFISQKSTESTRKLVSSFKNYNQNYCDETLISFILY